MAYRSRIKYSSEQKKELWDRWQRGRMETFPWRSGVQMGSKMNSIKF